MSARGKLLALVLVLAAIVVVGCVAFVRSTTLASSRTVSEPAATRESAGAGEGESAGESAGEDEGEGEGESAVVDAPVVVAAGPAAEPPPREQRPQFVLLGFDITPLAPTRGTEQVWNNINAGRDEAEPPRTFTIFIGTGGMTFDPASHHLSAADEVLRGVLPRNEYVFHYATARHDIDVTIENIHRLEQRGVEIGSHTVRHAHGREFSRERWDFELEDHQRILDLLGLPRPVGFRAPFLETNDDLYASLRAHGFTYDCSATQTGRRWPQRRGGDGVWVFTVPTVRIPGRDRSVLFYDLNLDARLHAAAVAQGIQGEDAIQAFMDRAFEDAAYEELMVRYHGSRAPFLISGHGGFQRPIGHLMRRVCGLPDVRCTSFREATAFMDAHPELANAD